MMVSALILLAALSAALGWFLLEALADLAVAQRNRSSHQATIESLRHRLASSEEIRHSVAACALRGSPAVKWTRPAPVPPASDPWYWRAMYDGQPHLFTDSALRQARTRASLLLSSCVT